MSEFWVSTGAGLFFFCLSDSNILDPTKIQKPPKAAISQPPGISRAIQEPIKAPVMPPTASQRTSLKRMVPGYRGIRDITDHVAGENPYYK